MFRSLIRHLRLAGKTQTKPVSAVPLLPSPVEQAAPQKPGFIFFDPKGDPRFLAELLARVDETRGHSSEDVLRLMQKHPAP